MSTGFISILALVSIVIWGTVSRELMKSSEKYDKERDKLKIITLMLAGILTTLLLTILLFQDIQF